MIHKFEMNGYRIVLDVASGAVHVVDEIAFGILDRYDPETEFVPKTEAEAEAAAEIAQLVDEGLLFSPEAEAVTLRAPVVKALCLHVAHDCNLRCGYCFAGDGKYHGQRSLMSADTGRAAIDFLVGASGARNNLEVDFFGGEPLMNLEVIKEVVAYGREQKKNIRFTLTTNGMLLNDEIQRYVNENMYNVVLSLDGRPQVNDRLRKRADGSGSYEAILPKLKSMAKSRENYYVRGTYTRYNRDFAKDVLHLAELGFDRVSVEPVVAPPDRDYALRPEDLPALKAEYEGLAAEILKREEQGRGFNFFHFMIDLTGGPCVAKRMSGCGAGVEYLAVTPEGELYPCHQFVGMPEFSLGHVKTGVTNTRVRDMFKGCNVQTKPECRRCWAKLYCSGGCAANGYNAHGDIRMPYELGCELQRKRVECAIMMSVHRA